MFNSRISCEETVKSCREEHLEQENHHGDRHNAQDRRHDIVDACLHSVFAAEDCHLDNRAAAGSAGADGECQTLGESFPAAEHDVLSAGGQKARRRGG